MSSLIKNELVKILKKKSFYIIMAITFIFIIFINIMYHTQQNVGNYTISDNYREYLEEELSKLNPENSSDVSIYIDLKKQLDSEELIKKYGGESWQAYIIHNNGLELLQNIYQYQYGPQKDESKRIEAQKQYDEFLEKLEQDDWVYFAKEQLENVNKELDNLEKQKEAEIDKVELKNLEDQIFDFNLQKQILNWRLEKNISYAMGDFNTALDKYYNASRSIREQDKSELSYQEKQEYYNNLKIVAINQYMIENSEEIKQGTKDAKGNLMNVLKEFEIFIIIIIVMIAGTIVSEEFNKGTIKLLLVRPYTRGKILAAKLIACLIMVIVAIFLICILQTVAGGIIHGFDSYSQPVIDYDYNEKAIFEMNIATYMAILILSKLPFYFLIAMIAFFISTLFTNSALAIVIALLGYMSSSMINMIAVAYDIKIMKFFITPNWNIDQYLWGGLPEFPYVTLGFSLAICAIYFIGMFIVSMIVFKKRNIKNI